MKEINKFVNKSCPRSIHDTNVNMLSLSDCCQDENM